MVFVVPRDTLFNMPVPARLQPVGDVVRNGRSNTSNEKDGKQDTGEKGAHSGVYRMCRRRRYDASSACASEYAAHARVRLEFTGSSQIRPASPVCIGAPSGLRHGITHERAYTEQEIIEIIERAVDYQERDVRKK
jgi:hypothetical protein